MAFYRVPAAGFATGAGQLPRAVRELSAEQITAIRTVMQLFVEEDEERGLSSRHTVDCGACGKLQPAAGSITYEDLTLCNACALDYELGRASGQVRNAAEYARLRHGRPQRRPATAR